MPKPLAIDEPRMALLQHLFVTQPPAFHGARQEVLDQHIGARDQLFKQRAPGRHRQVDADVAFAAVHRAEVRRHAVAVEWGAKEPSLVARRCLDLDDFGTMVCQQLGAQWTGQYARQIEHAQAVKRRGSNHVESNARLESGGCESSCQEHGEVVHIQFLHAHQLQLRKCHSGPPLRLSAPRPRGPPRQAKPPMAPRASHLPCPFRAACARCRRCRVRLRSCACSGAAQSQSA